MPEYSFRLRFRLAERNRIAIAENRIDLSIPGILVPVQFSAPTGTASLAESLDVIAKAGGFAEETSAKLAVQRLTEMLSVTLARLGIGADFGSPFRGGWFTPAGLQMLESSSGRRTLNNTHGAMVFESEPSPVFAGMGPAQLIANIRQDQFVGILLASARLANPVPSAESLAFELYHSSFFESQPRSRFLTLMIANDRY